MPSHGDYALIESLLHSGSYERVEQHLARLRRSARELGFRLDEGEIASALTGRAADLGPGPHKVRIELSRDGSFSIGSEPVEAPSGALEVMLAEARLDSSRPLALHKTSRRDFFEAHAAAARKLGLVDVVFLNERDELAEASSNNVFLEAGSELLTPPVSAGILPGVYRQSLLDTEPGARTAVLYERDLAAADSILLSNSVRGLRRVVLRPGLLRV